MPRAIRVPTGDYMARLHWRLRARLPLWAVFGPGTIEYPHHWVARMHVVLPEARVTRFVITHDTLEGLRAILPPALTYFPRHPHDPPYLVEVWL
jgi:hypothetical protein